MKIKTIFSCQNCGHSSAKWLGRCPGCDSWNTFVEERESGAEQQSSSGIAAVRDEFRTARDSALENAGVHGAYLSGGQDFVSLDLSPDAGDSLDSKSEPKPHLRRISTGMGELDRVLGGGLVPDSFVLLGGDPGIGKSTLLLQMAKGLTQKQRDIKLLYVSGEESIDQIRGRAHRLGIQGEGRIFLAAETILERVFATVKELKPDVIVMDSLQTFSSSFLQSAPGSVSQLREVAARLMALAKTAGISVWLVGHVTKDGSIAGPKVVEHMVDTVLYFESEGGQSYRLLRTVKNRFGSSRELGVFEMEGEGLKEVLNPSSLFLSERTEKMVGTAITASLEGSRPILCELQALVATSGLAVPRRTSVGMDSARIALLAAILEKHMNLPLAQKDLFFNVAGGLRLSEPACDLAAVAAIWSSAMDIAMPTDMLFMGEVGLTGEIRRVSFPEVRLDEAQKLGFNTVVLPKGTPSDTINRAKTSSGLKVISVGRIDELPKKIYG
ncbi:MAG: DNA repair protein RadA [Bdellovibrionota bacterium]